MTKPLDGKPAIVTGATRGIGRAIAERLRDDGARVLGTGTRPDGQAPDGCGYAAVDFTDPAATESFVVRLRELAPLILVNNAGVSRPELIDDIETDEFRRVHQVNVVAPLILCRAVAPGMRAAGWGRIVNIGSVRGVFGGVARASYSSSKFGVDGLTAGIAAELARDGILVNTVSPGFIDTEMSRDVYTPEARAFLLSQIPVGRLGTPEDIAAFVAWLAGPENTYISGQQLVIDGGLVRGGPATP